MTTYLFISAYILSLLVALVLFITGKNRSRSGIGAVIALHGTALAWLVSTWIRSLPEPGYAFLAFLSTGLLGAGWILRSAANRYLRIYFSLFLLTLLFFIYSPSRFASFLVHADLADRSPPRFHLYSNYYLEQQPAFHHPVRFKVVRQFGLFHKTLRRDIALPATPDSVAAGRPDARGQFPVRVYFHTGDSSGTVEFQLSLSPETADTTAGL